MRDARNYWESERIRLRSVQPSDAEIFYQWNLDSERAQALDFTWPPTSLAAVRRWAEETAYQKLEGDCFVWVIENLEGNPLGSISTHSCSPRSGTFSYGIDIAPEFRRYGYAGEAIQIILRYYFEELRYQKVTVPVHASNTASIQLHEKMRFSLEGRLRRMHYTGGHYEDVLWFGLTDDEWRARL